MGDAGSFDGYSSLDESVKESTSCLTPPPIAIVGIGLRLPGGVNSTASLWDLLISKKDGRSLVPSDRYNVDAFHKPSKTMGSVASQYGYFLKDNISKFDASFFSMSKAEAEKMDPQQRLLLEVVWECMQSGGQKDWRGGNIGCYVGVFGDDWLDMGAKDAQNYGLYRVSGSESLGVSNRISYEYDLKGPSMTIRTGCSSSLVALHEACKAISCGDCSSAIVAGANLILTPTMTMAMTEQGVLSPEGISKSFDASADGYGRGEGINAVYIKNLSDAIRDGDQIRAVIRATASNCDGRTAGISMPSPAAHEAMIRHAYDIAGIENFSETAFVECHATGTAVGDPLEASAIARVFGGETGVFIGSIKPNIGHGEGASGLSSLIKATLALENKTIPPNIHFHTPNPKIPFAAANLRVPVEAIPWPEQQLERASVNSFGIGGANAHVILESATFHGLGVQPTRGALDSPSPQLLVFSSHDSKVLQQQIQKVESYIEEHPQSLADVSYTLALHRDHLPIRGFGVKSHGEPLQVSSPYKFKKVPDVVFIMTGQGAQWAGMGRELAREFPSFLIDIRRMQSALATVPHPPKWDILDELLKPETESLLTRSEYAQPLCTAIQIAMINILRSWGVTPVAVIGHSSGEIASAFASGSINADEAIKIAYYRGLGTCDVSKPGGMAAVGLGKNEVTPFLKEGVVVACDNSPKSVTLSGDNQALSDVMNDIKESKPEAFLRKLRVEMAYHSHHMKGIGKAYESSLDLFVDAQEVKVPFYSSVTGLVTTEKGALGPAYWRKNLESPVLFYSAVTSYLKDSENDSLFVEIGPHSALGGPLRQIFKECKVAYDLSYASCLERKKDASVSMLQLAGNLYQRGVPLDLGTIVKKASTLNDLPAYPWAHEVSYWSETRAVREWRLRQHPRHELLGSRIVEGTDLEPTWRNIFSLEDASWIRDHRINNDIVYPGAAYICMAGAACQQLTAIDDYTIRDFAIKTALVLKEDAEPEILTSLQPVRLTDSLNSEWFDFSIASFNGVWVQHCTGQVKAGGDTPNTTPIETFPRKVITPYQGLKSVGLNYGHHFRGLKDVTASPGSKTAAAIVAAPTAKIQDVYQLHPTSIDCCLQLFMIAASEGIARRMDRLFVPTGFSHLYIGRSKPITELHAQSICSTYSPTSITGNAAMTSKDGEMLFCLQNCRFSPVEADVTELDNTAAAKLHWGADMEFMNAHRLLLPLRDESLRNGWLIVERLAMACMVEMNFRLGSSWPVAASSHLDKFASWISSQIKTTSKRDHLFYQYLIETQKLTSAMRCNRIEELFQEGLACSASPAASLVKKIFDNYFDLFSGQIEPLQILLPDDGLTLFYDALDTRADRRQFYACLGHSNPQLRILEIGAGTGGTTSRVLKSLVNTNGSRMYAKYTYTDVSSGFFANAQERFKAISNIEFKILDITKDLATQGFEGEQFDLIIAANVLHATPSLHQTLSNVYKLCAPGGRLFLEELSPSVMQSVNFIMGILPGWWLGDSDNRSREPYVSPARWNEELQAAGFSGTEIVAFDDVQPYHLNADIMSRRLAPEPLAESTIDKSIGILGSDFSSPQIQHLIKELKQHGFQLETFTLDDPTPACHSIISVLDLVSPFLHNISSSDFAKFQRFTSEVGSTRVLWLTRLSQLNCSDPLYGQILGLARTLRAETSVDFTTLELDATDENAWKAVISVLNKIQSRSLEESSGGLDPDFEYILLDGVVQVGRYHALEVDHKIPVPFDEAAPIKLEIGKLGLLQSLSWKQQALLPALGDLELEVEPRYVGLNFRDVLSSMGIIEASKGGLGLEASGVVRKIGSAVQDFVVGDRVIIFKSGCFSSKMHVSSMLCAKIPDSISDKEAATMPTVYSTVVHSLLNLGNLKKNQSVLIHSACGGVGLAAIQICRHIGAKIYVSAGNKEKVSYLLTKFGIPREHIFHSRDASFLPALMNETAGRGVDIVLNSLSGELLHASWKCVAPGGRFIELGKRDFIGRGKLSMDIFEDNRSFFGVDLNRFTPEQSQPLLIETVRLLKEGRIRPITPTKVFQFSEVEESFRYMQKGTHIGKVLVQMPQEATQIPTAVASKALQLSSEKTYLLVGGLGGLGRAISIWMVECGARNFVYLSRSAGSPKDQAFINELQVEGCLVKCVAGSVSDIEAVERAVAAAESPIGGVLQMSMVLRDQLFSEHKFEDWNAVVQAKIQGTMNVHNSLLDQNLDFFVLFSSISGIIGNRGQSAYAAANTFLDSFVSYRHGIGLACSCMDIGMLGSIGYLADIEGLQDLLKGQEYHELREIDLLDSLQLSIASNKPWETRSSACGSLDNSQFVLGLRSQKQLSDPTCRTLWKHDKRMSLYHNVTTITTNNQSNTSGASGFAKFKTSIESDPSLLDSNSTVDFLGTLIGSQIYLFMMRSVEELDLEQSLTGLGIDSLVTIEIRNWWRRTLGLEVSTLEILGAGTIRGLVGLAIEGLKIVMK